MNRPLIFANNDVNQQQPNSQSPKLQYVQQDVYDDDSAQENVPARYGSNTRQYPQSYAASNPTPQDNRDYNNRYTADHAEKQRKYNNDKISAEYENPRTLQPRPGNNNDRLTTRNTQSFQPPKMMATFDS